MKQRRWMAAILGITFFAGHSASAAHQYRFSGTVQALSGDAVTVKGPGETLEFMRGKSSTFPKDLKVGDSITLWFKMETQRASRADRQQPGTVAPEGEDSPQHIILDDRAFYNARNEKRQTENPTPPHS